MKIAIIGTRGIPNYYGGFEQFAEYLAKYLVGNGHKVSVYNSHYHPYQEKEWKGVKIIHKYDPENKIGTSGQFIYDLKCILDSRKRDFDIILQLGYTSSSIWGKLLPNKAKVVTNMDGLEWKRSKYNRYVRRFLLWAEKLGIKYSDYLVSDSMGIQEYIQLKYNQISTYIPYGADVVEAFSLETLSEYDVKPYQFSMLIARLEPENSIEVILDGVRLSSTQDLFLVVGKHETAYGRKMKKKYSNDDRIRFLGGIYDIDKLNDLRYYAKIYFHGHTVGGTNPSLLEAMGSKALICANNNVFNKSILGKDALYFSSSDDISEMLNIKDYPQRGDFIYFNTEKIIELYGWSTIVSQYESLFIKALNN